MALDVDTARTVLLAREERVLRLAAARAEAVRDGLPAAARVLRVRYGASEVILFGSLAWGGFHADSDVDIAVRGIDEAALGRAEAELGRVLEARVELFDLDALPASFESRVTRDGEVVP